MTEDLSFAAGFLTFSAGWLLCWATMRHHVRNAELRQALTHAWQGRA